jgi:hypothetical protein
MPNLINNSMLFNGTVDTADQFSTPVNLTNSTAWGRELAFYFQLETTATGDMGCTLQFNPNSIGSTDYSWQDVASTDITILNTLTSSNLPQTDVDIEGGEIRGGIVTAIGNYNLLLRFYPLPFQYRLRFQIDANVIAEIPKIMFTSGG